MSKSIERYAKKRAEAIREYRRLCKRLLSPWYTVDDINKAFRIKKLYNL